LYEILTKFNEAIFTKFRLNIQEYPTLPSLTFAIFRSNYLKDIEKDGYYIPLISDNIYNDIKESYTGGSTDMFTPQSSGNNNIRCYDVNSLYPTVMKEELVPVISKGMNYITYFEGDISLIDSKAFGFFNVDVESPEYLEHPILQLHYNSGRSIRTISPLGK
jgi:hypothetical protein